jgi:hypothetical protein
VIREILALWVLKVQLDQEVFKETWVPKATKEMLERLVPKAIKEILVLRGQLEHRVLRDQ